MKKVNLVLSLIFLLLVSANSAKAQESKSRFGIKGGLNVSGLHDKNIDDRDPLLGFNGGLFLKLALSDHIAFGPEILYSSKGGKLNYKEGPVTGTGTFHFDYIDVPFLAVVNVTSNFNIHAGIYIASLIKAKFKNDSNFNGLDTDEDLNTDDFETLDYGLAGGVAVDADRVSIGARYEYGLNTIGKERTTLGQSYKFPDATNSTFQIYVAISIL